jgi:hypothetical protein
MVAELIPQVIEPMEADAPQGEFLHSSLDAAGGRTLYRAECIYCSHVIVAPTLKAMKIAERAHLATCKPK